MPENIPLKQEECQLLLCMGQLGLSLGCLTSFQAGSWSRGADPDSEVYSGRTSLLRAPEAGGQDT